MVKVALCEDESIQRKIIKSYLDKIYKALNVEYKLLEFESGEELLNNYPKDVDLILLDIQMNKLNGMDTARKVRDFDSNVSIIFTTSDAGFMQDGYEVRAYRYLLKPISYEVLKIHLNACINEINDNKSKYIIIKENNNGEIIRIPVNTILYIETEKRYLVVHTDSNAYTTRVSISKLEEELSELSFFRCHRCYLVNLEKIKSITSSSVIINDKEILVSRYKMKELKIKMVNILGDIL